MPGTFAIVCSLDTKGPDAEFVRAELAKRGQRALTIDTSVLGESAGRREISPEQVAEAAGASLSGLRGLGDRGQAIAAMARGAAKIVRGLYDTRSIQGVIGLGGGAGTAVGTAAMRELPLGVPKVMITTLASGTTSAYIREKDIIMFPSIVDVAGINRVSARMYANAVGAAVGMLETPVAEVQRRALVAASMFGNTTATVERARKSLESGGYELLAFHATGTGGRALEALVREGEIAGVLDVTTSELGNELVGGVLSAGPERLTAAGQSGVPQVVVPGCLDMVNFREPETVPARFAGRRFHVWNPHATLMRTTPEENAAIGRILARKLNAAAGPVAIFLPLRGLSLLDAPGKEFWWPEADQALFGGIRAHLDAKVELYEMDCNINDAAFADRIAGRLLHFLKG